MGLTSHLSDAYDAFSSSCISFSLLLSPMKMSLKNLTNLTMKVLVPSSPLVCVFLHVLNYLLIVLVDFYLIEPSYPLVVSVEYFQGSKFPD